MTVASRMSSEMNGPFALPLPRHRDARIVSKPSVWVLDSNGPEDIPLAECDRRGREGGVCCKDLKDKDRRTLINPDIVRDV